MRSKKIQHVAEQLKRKRGTRDARPRFLICFEDGKSAPRYFDALRKHRGFTRESFVVDFDSSGTDPASVVQRANELKSRLSREDTFSEDDGDQVWCVVDIDQHSTMKDAQKLAQSAAIELAISNPCFEYWVLLHFEESAHLVADCAELIRRYLRKHIADYNKGRTDFSAIVDQADVAAERAARQLEGKAESDPLQCCPCTLVFRLIRSISRLG